MGGYLHALLVQEGAAFGTAPAFVGPVVINTPVNQTNGLLVNIVNDASNAMACKNLSAPAGQRCSFDVFNDGTFQLVTSPDGANFLFMIFDAASLDMQFWADGFQANTTRLGFYSAPTVAKPTVAGSKGANAALASLMAALALLGLVTDTTT